LTTYCTDCKYAIEQVHPDVFWCTKRPFDTNKYGLSLTITNRKYFFIRTCCDHFKWKIPITRGEKLRFLVETLTNP
jgi:hypothetical protein